MAPRAYLQQLDQLSSGDAQNRSAEDAVLGSSLSDTRALTEGANLSNRFTMRRRFTAKRGRNLTAEVNVGLNTRDTDGTNASLTETIEGLTTTRDTVDQVSDARAVTRTLSGRVSFTEPLSANWQGQMFYNPSLTRSTSDTRVFDRDARTGAYDALATGLSSSLESRVAVQNGGVSFLRSMGPWRWLSSVALQEQRVQSTRSFPEGRDLWRRYVDVLPSMQLTANLPNQRSVRIAWNTSTAAPTIAQLQDVVNNSNPLALSTGNPFLRPTYSHTLSLRASAADPARSRSRFAFLNLTRTSDPIVTSYITAPGDTVLEGVTLARGTQLSRPVNLDESWSANLFGVMSRPASLLKSNLSVNGGLTWTRNPTLNQGVTGRTDNWSIRSGATLASNISQNLDFTVSYQGRYNMARRTRTTGGTGDYFTHNASLRLNATVGPGITIRQEMTHTLQTQASDAFDPDNLLWTSSLGKRFGKDGRGDFRITATDVLEQERSAGRSITETYIEDTRDRVLGRYLQAVLSYSFR
jgi:hypothetical protein